MTPFKPHLKKKRIKLSRGSVAWKKLVKEVFERDRYRCRVCDNIFPKNLLAPHHLKSVGSGGGDEKNNLVAICQFCHRGFHRGNPEIMKKINKIKEHVS